MVPGEYTVAFTCQALDDHPDTDEVDEAEIAFGGQVNAAVVDGQDTVNEAQMIADTGTGLKVHAQNGSDKQLGGQHF